MKSDFFTGSTMLTTETSRDGQQATVVYGAQRKHLFNNEGAFLYSV